jgi:hypothetical protein
VRSVRPASGADREIQLEVEASKALRERVVLTLRIRDQAQRQRSLEIVLTSLEARKLGHMLLDEANPTRSSRGDD